MGAHLELACDYIGINRNTPSLWIRTASKIEELILKDIEVGRNSPLTEEDRLYLEFISTVRKAAAKFDMRQLGIMNAAGGMVDPKTGKFIIGDWRAALTLLQIRRARRYNIPKEVPFEADPIGLDSELIGQDGGSINFDAMGTVDMLQYVYETEILSTNGTSHSDPNIKGNGTDI
jgi:hypothetical protein